MSVTESPASAPAFEVAVGDIWYRMVERYISQGYVDECGDYISGESRIELVFEEYRVVKVTPKGVQLSAGLYEDRLVLFGSYKKFACPTKEQARRSFVARKDRQIKILKAQLRSSTTARDKALWEISQEAENDNVDEMGTTT